MPILLKPSPVVKRKGKVIVVGGGIMGASAAWHLSKAGAAVTLIERAPNCLTTATAIAKAELGL